MNRGATEAECRKVVQLLQLHFAGEQIGFEILEDEVGFVIFVVSQEGPINLQMYLPKGWYQTDWFGTEHRGYRTSIIKV